MDSQDEVQSTQITDKFKDLQVTTDIEKVSDTPLTIPQNVRPPKQLLRNVMSIADLLGQKKMLTQVTVTTSSVRNTLVQAIAFSQDYVTEHLGISADTAGRFFTGWRCDCIEVTVEMTSMYQQQGALLALMTNMPAPFFNAAGHRNNQAHMCKFPRKFMTFGQNGTYVFSLGWNSILKFWPLPTKVPEGNNRAKSLHNSYMDNGRIEIRVFDPLKIATGVNDRVQLRIWVQLKGLELGVYSPNNLL